MVKEFIFNLFKDYLQGLRYLSSAECKGATLSYLCNENDNENDNCHPEGNRATESHSFMKQKFQSSQPTLSYRVGVIVNVSVENNFQFSIFKVRANE